MFIITVYKGEVNLLIVHIHLQDALVHHYRACTNRNVCRTYSTEKRHVNKYLDALSSSVKKALLKLR